MKMLEQGTALRTKNFSPLRPCTQERRGWGMRDEGWDTMKKTEVTNFTYVGVDVPKAKSDVYRANTKKSETIANEEADIEQFCKTFKRLKSPVMVVVEAVYR